MDSQSRNKRKGGETPVERRRYPAIRAALRAYLAALLSAALLTLAFPPVNFSPLAYVALVPLLVMAVRAATGGRVFRAAWLAGTLFFAVNLYWVWPVTMAGYIALMPYLGLYWAVFAWGVRRIGQTTRLPLAILAPLLWVPLELVRAWLLTGLPWIFVGHTQYENLTLIQTADALGAYGPSFLIMMTSGLVADLLARPLFVAKASEGGCHAFTGESMVPHPPRAAHAFASESMAPSAPARRFSRAIILMIILTAAAWTATVWYGLWRLGETERRAGPIVASVQTCLPQEIKQAARLKHIEKFEEEMLDGQRAQTTEILEKARAEGLRPDLICWPETMVPGIQNQDFLETDLKQHLSDTDMLEVFDYYPRRSRMFWKNIRETAREAGAPILYGAHAVEIEGAYRLPGGGFMTLGPRFNTAFLIGPDTKPYAAEHTYAKSHLVPFGEYLPFKETLPWFHAWLLSFTPYTYDYNLTPGAADQAPFVLRYAGGEARFQAPICYEDAMPYRIRQMVRSDDPERPKAVDFLVNISNDGWFTRGLLTKESPLGFLNVGGLAERWFGWFGSYGSVELDQHLALCVFRAVENRVPIVRSVNTGVSALIASDGRVEQIVERQGRHRYLTGQIVGRLALDDRVAPYTRLGDAFAEACLGTAAVLAALAAYLAIRKQKETDA
jgi:apolipoprotein N-acyltransferase